MIGNYHINKMTWKIKNALNLNPDQERLVREVMEAEWKDKIADVWHIDDVKATANKMDVDLTDAQIDEVLNRIANNRDASMGINWEVIEATIEALLRE